MNRLLLAVLCLGISSQAFALGAAESSLGLADKAFTELSGFKLKNPLRRFDARTGLPAAGVVKVKGTSKYVTLRGFVSVSGTAFVSNQTGYVFITVSGDTQLSDNSGHYVNGFVTVTDTSGYYVNGSYVSGWPRPSGMVTLYQNGRYLGTIRVDGNIPVSGYNSGGWIRVSGSGWVEGSGWINVEEPQTP
ncbi:MAG: hypothetical protein HY925_11230 [Elusimicrobia bacterium]|nr:hypothetical protein [Elusimicrobiota bacterium]